MRRPARHQGQTPDQAARPAAPQHPLQSVHGRGKVPEVPADDQRQVRLVDAGAGRQAGDVREGVDQEVRRAVQAAGVAHRGAGVVATRVNNR